MSYLLSIKMQLISNSTFLGLAVDYIHRRLYFANLGQSSPKLDGAVFTWHRIEMIGLDGRGRRTIVTDVDKPRSLQLDLENR